MKGRGMKSFLGVLRKFRFQILSLAPWLTDDSSSDWFNTQCLFASGFQIAANGPSCLSAGFVILPLTLPIFKDTQQTLLLHLQGSVCPTAWQIVSKNL